MTGTETKKPGLFGRLFGKGGGEQQQAPAASVDELEPVAETVAAFEQQQPQPERPASSIVVVEAPAAPQPAPEAPPQKKSWFERLRQGLRKTSTQLTQGIATVFTKRKLDAATLEELEDLLIQADLGLDTSSRIIDRLSDGRYDKEISAAEVSTILAEEVEKVLAPVAKPLVLNADAKPHVILIIGVNGTGKTTTIGKLARIFADEGKRVMLAAGDTFRAAAVEQLKVWGERTGAPVVAGETGADAAGLAFDALRRARDEGRDVLIIDTAGRLQNKAHLMAELEKIVRVIKKFDATAPHSVLLTLDATTGQNALNQVEVFRQTAGVTGLIMTKLDGTARGGILVAIAAKYGLPVHAIGVGETVEDLQPFAPRDFARAIAGIEAAA